MSKELGKICFRDKTRKGKQRCRRNLGNSSSSAKAQKSTAALSTELGNTVCKCPRQLRRRRWRRKLRDTRDYGIDVDGTPFASGQDTRGDGDDVEDDETRKATATMSTELGKFVCKCPRHENYPKRPPSKRRAAMAASIRGVGDGSGFFRITFKGYLWVKPVLRFQNSKPTQLPRNTYENLNIQVGPVHPLCFFQPPRPLFQIQLIIIMPS